MSGSPLLYFFRHKKQGAIQLLTAISVDAGSEWSYIQNKYTIILHYCIGYRFIKNTRFNRPIKFGNLFMLARSAWTKTFMNEESTNTRTVVKSKLENYNLTTPTCTLDLLMIVNYINKSSYSFQERSLRRLSYLNYV